MANPVAFLRWLARVNLHPDATPAAMQVAAVLATFPTRPEGNLYPSVETIAERAGLTRKGAQKGLQVLIRIGQLRVTRGGGRERTNTYFPAVDTSKSGSPIPVQETANIGSQFQHETANARSQNSVQPFPKKANGCTPEPTERTYRENLHDKPSGFAHEDRGLLVGKIKPFGFDSDSAAAWADRLIEGGVDRAKLHAELARISVTKTKGRHEARKAFEAVGNALVKPLARTALRVVAPAKRPMDDTDLDFPPAEPVERSTSIAQPTLKQREAAASAAPLPGADPQFCDQRVCISVQGVAR